MRRNQIIFGTVLVLVLASFWGVYQFYFKEKLDQYKKDLQFRKDLEASAEEISTFFSGTAPETVITRWNNEVQPWRETLENRSRYFDNGKWFEHETPPESGRILRVWYGEELEEMLNKLYQDIAEKAPQLQTFPENILTSIEVMSESDMAQENEVTVPLVNQQLGRLAFASRFINLLLDEKIVGLNGISIWPRRQDKNHKGQLVLQTVGVDVNIYMRHLVHLLETLRRQNRYFHIDAIHVGNRYIADQAEPVLQVRLLITQGYFSGNLDEAAAGGAASAKSLYEISSPKAGAKKPAAPPEEPGFLGKAWKWFRRVVLYQNVA